MINFLFTSEEGIYELLRLNDRDESVNGGLRSGVQTQSGQRCCEPAFTGRLILQGI